MAVVLRWTVGAGLRVHLQLRLRKQVASVEGAGPQLIGQFRMVLSSHNTGGI